MVLLSAESEGMGWLAGCVTSGLCWAAGLVPYFPVPGQAPLGCLFSMHRRWLGEEGEGASISSGPVQLASSGTKFPLMRCLGNAGLFCRFHPHCPEKPLQVGKLPFPPTAGQSTSPVPGPACDEPLECLSLLTLIECFTTCSLFCVLFLC